MSTPSTTSTGGRRRSGPATVSTALRVVSVLSTLTILFQGATAGEVLMRNHAARELHETGAVVLHVLAGLTVLAAAALWWATRAWAVPTSPVPAVVAVLVFGLSFLQGATGHGRSLWIHVPLAMVLLLGAVWVTSWSWLRRPGERR